MRDRGGDRAALLSGGAQGLGNAREGLGEVRRHESGLCGRGGGPARRGVARGERRRLGSAGGERDHGSRTAKPSQSTPGLGSLEPRSERATGRREGRRRPAKLGGEFAGVARGGGERRRRRSTPEGLPVGTEEGKRDRMRESEGERLEREREGVVPAGWEEREKKKEK